MNKSDTKFVLVEMNEPQLTDEDRNSIAYFILERGDVTRWSQWQEKKHLVMIHYPELIMLLDQRDFIDSKIDVIAHNLAYKPDLKEPFK